MIGSAAITSCAAAPATRDAFHGTPKRDRPVITLTHGTEPEQATRRQLERLFDEYDLSLWSFTARVEIDEAAIPHSHPVLTLSTRHLRDDLLLLATYVHEQSHWYFDSKSTETHATMAELEVQFPGLPVGFPDGAIDHDSNYLHLCVIPFEYAGMRRLVGELRARQVLEFWAADHYRVLYRTVLDSYRPLLAHLKAHGLEPPAPPR